MISPRPRVVITDCDYPDVEQQRVVVDAAGADLIWENLRTEDALIAGLADAMSADAFDAEKAGAVAGDRVKSAEKLRDAVVKALTRIHAMLKPEQRAKFAYLIRTGALTL